MRSVRRTRYRSTNVSSGRRDYIDRLLIGRKHLPCRHSEARRPAAVHRDFVGLAVLVPVVVPEFDPVALARQNPRSRTVGADNERTANAVFLALTNMHNQSFVLERRIISRCSRDSSGKRLAAQFLQFVPKYGTCRFGLCLCHSVVKQRQNKYEDGKSKLCSDFFMLL
jgi:hypothetical protein